MPTLEEVRKVIPLDALAGDIKEQNLFANILDWCRDYYNLPKITFWQIAETLDREYRDSVVRF